MGAAYLFVRDRNIDTVVRAGRQAHRHHGLRQGQRRSWSTGSAPSWCAADLGSIGPKFNNGDVDACYVSAPGYRPFELHRGLGSSGGILKAPLAQATLQIMLRESQFPAGFVENSRQDLLGRFDDALSIIERAEADIPDQFWVDIPDETLASWNDMFQGVRVSLRDQEQAYDGAMLSVMKQLRCSSDPSRSECAESKE